eukprot:402467_1
MNQIDENELLNDQLSILHEDRKALEQAVKVKKMEYEELQKQTEYDYKADEEAFNRQLKIFEDTKKKSNRKMRKRLPQNNKTNNDKETIINTVPLHPNKSQTKSFDNISSNKIDLTKFKDDQNDKYNRINYLSDSKEIEIDDNDPLFKPKKLFSDNCQHKLIRAKFKNYMDDEKQEAIKNEQNKPIKDADNKPDMPVNIEETCIIDDYANASAATYVLNKQDYNEWIINKIMKKTNFDALIKDKNKKYIPDTDFWKFIKQWCIKQYKKKADENYAKFVAKAKRRTQKLITQDPGLVKHLSFDQIAAIHFYTLKDFYKGLNASLRDGKDNWAPFCGPMSIALYKLPFIDFDKVKNMPNTVYRGFCLKHSKKQETQEQRQRIRESTEYDKGSIVRWSSFTSTTIDKQVAEIYAGEDIVYEIEGSFHGKNIAKFSSKPDEAEILFNLSSHFLICDTKMKGKTFYVKLKEFPFPWDAKTILWVDDNPGNNKKLMEKCERNGIMVIPRISTQGALEFFDFMNYAFQRDAFKKFRVITDMYRAEWIDDDKEQKQQDDADAGVTLIQKLRERNYTNTVCIY